MKKFFKNIKSIHILWVSGIAIFLLVLALLYPEVDKIIQSELIVILVIITLFYAIQTQKLVKHEKITLEEERKKKIAMFAENKLHEFYSPFSVNLFLLNKKIEGLNWQNFKDELDKIDEFFTEEISELIEKYSYLSPKETAGLTATINIFFKDVNELKENEEERFYIIKQEFLKTIMSILTNINKKSVDCIEKINKVYDFYKPSDIEDTQKILSIGLKAIKDKK